MTPTETRNISGDTSPIGGRPKRSLPLALVAAPILAASLLLAGWVATRPDPPRIPAHVALVGNLAEALGCSREATDCAATRLEPTRVDPGWLASRSPAQRHFLVRTETPVWSKILALPAGRFQIWVDEDDGRFGVGGRREGPPLEVVLEAPRPVTFLYSHETHAFSADAVQPIAVAVGSFQRLLGCRGDWQDDCLITWMTDADFVGSFTLQTQLLPKGDFEVSPSVRGQPPGESTRFTLNRDAEPVRFEWIPGSSRIRVEFPERKGVGP